MKNIAILTALVILFLQGYSQTADDALRYSQDFYTGSARNMAMGSAFSTLGADFSAASINPAGLGLYRGNEMSITPLLNVRNSESEYNGTYGNDNQTVFCLGQFSYVLAQKLYSAKQSDWKYYQFSFGMNRLNNFNTNLYMSGNNYNSSKMDVYLGYANGIFYKDIEDDYYGDYAFDLKPAWDLYLLDTIPGYTDQYYSPVPPGGFLQREIINSDGSKNEYTFSFSGNYNDFLYLGATVGMPYIRYFSTAAFTETDIADTIPTFNSWGVTQYLQTTGWGINLKLGVIVRPVSWLRLGAAFHTPTYYYNMRDTWHTTTYADLPGLSPAQTTSPVGNFNYSFTTPLKAIGSAAITIMKNGALSFEYEFVDYSTARFKERGVDYSQPNGDIKQYYKKAGNIRAGAEWRFGILSLRGGYAYYGSPYKNNLNDASRQFVSGGLGFNFDHFMLDFAYIHSNWKDQYYMYSFQDMNPVNNSFADNSFLVTLKLRY